MGHVVTNCLQITVFKVFPHHWPDLYLNPIVFRIHINLGGKLTTLFLVLHDSYRVVGETVVLLQLLYCLEQELNVLIGLLGHGILSNHRPCTSGN